MNTKKRALEIYQHFGLKISDKAGLEIFSPIDGESLGFLHVHSETQINDFIKKSIQAFLNWRFIPAPKRGELIRVFGNVLREHKEILSQLISLECGKIIEESRGEVQEMIDICDFAVGISRQLYGLTIASERFEHNMYETWHPLGPIGVITAFNFPAAVWAWNFALAIVCGNSVIWKPSEKTPITALACQTLFLKASSSFSYVPQDLSCVLIGGHEAATLLSDDKRLPLISATGSSRMGQEIGPRVASRFGKSLLELGGNNAVIVTAHADIDLVVSSLLFGAVGTAGQRCTTTRRVFAHASIIETLLRNLKNAYQNLEDKIGDPLDEKNLLGPLIDESSYFSFVKSLKQAKQDGAEVWCGTRVLEKKYPKAFYVHPALIKMPNQTRIVCEETFAPILYIMQYEALEEAVKLNNAVAQGLSSSIFTNDLREAEYFRQHSDCGIANVNIGTSGAEVGAAFGGEKETGGGREAGSDSWKAYMRRQTSTIYYGKDKPQLAQGLVFE